MKHLMLFENFNWKLFNTQNERIYTFSSNNWLYKISVIENVTNMKYPYLGFRAKKEDDYFYDMSIITNDDIFKVMNTIKNIVKYDLKNNYNLGYTFSLTGDIRKSNQRLKLYQKLFKDELNMTFDDKNNHYILKKIQ